MTRTFSIKKLVLILSFFILTLIMLGISAFNGHSLANKYRRSLENTYKYSLEELSEYTASIETTIKKGLYANTSTQQHKLAARLLTESNGAKSAISHLPLADIELDHVGKFISQIGDFSLYLSKKISSGNKITEGEFENLKQLYEHTKKTNESIKKVLEHFEDGNHNIIELSDDINKNSGQEPFINSGFKEMDQIFSDYPTLIYDGPFSDHISRMTPKLLEDKEMLDENKLKEIASKFLEVDKDSLTKSNEKNCSLSSICFKLGENSEISVAKKGGYVDYMIKPRHVEVSTMGPEESMEFAKKFLIQHGYKNMQENYYSSANGICTINFAYTENDITYYSDLIKVGVALDNGEVVSFESTGYIMNHFKRNIPKNIVTESSARESVSKFLAIESSSIVLSPTDGLIEILCYEFKCINENNEEILIYINAETCLEENIFIVKKSENSHLVS